MTHAIIKYTFKRDTFFEITVTFCFALEKNVLEII